MFFDSAIFIILEIIYEKPCTSLLLYTDAKVRNYNYPIVYTDENDIVSKYCHDHIRHKTLTDVFDEGLRILIKPHVNIKDTEVKYRIDAKNLANHIEGFLKILIK